MDGSRARRAVVCQTSSSLARRAPELVLGVRAAPESRCSPVRCSLQGQEPAHSPAAVGDSRDAAAASDPASLRAGSSDGPGPTLEEAELAYRTTVTQGAPRAPVPPQGPGAQLADYLYVFGCLLDRPFGSGQSIAAAGQVVIEKVKTDTEALREGPGDQQLVFELLRVLQLLAMDLKLVEAARKQETLFERLEQAKVHCRQAIQLAYAL
eukprot:SM000212S06886  [mRNA]  locus=s212:52707:57142:- [translate_table: standard]